MSALMRYGCGMQFGCCKTCGVSKPRTSEFWHSEKTAADGFRSHCKDCRNLYRSKLHVAQYADPTYRQKKIEASSTYYAVNGEAARAAAREYHSRPEIKGKRRDRDSTKRRCDPEFSAKQKQMSQAWYEANKKRHRDRATEWAKQNPERISLINKTRNANRRARKLAAEGRYTPNDLFIQYEKQGRRCYWCEAPIELGMNTADHVIPLSRGGSNWPSNIVAACASCNCAKRDKLPDEFRAYLARRQANNA